MSRKTLALLGALIIAEGIETDEQAAQLKTLGCHEGQGFHWAPGLPVDQAEQLLAGGDWPARDLTTPQCAYMPVAV